MKCLTDGELTDYLVDETTPEGKKEAKEHLRACSACRGRLAALGFAAAAAAVPPAPVSGDFTSKLMARIREEEAAAPTLKSARLFAWPNSGKLVFAACALTLLAVFFFQAGRAPVFFTPRTLYLADGPATPVRLAALTSPSRSAPEAERDGMYFSDSCRTAGCGL